MATKDNNSDYSHLYAKWEADNDMFAEGVTYPKDEVIDAALFAKMLSLSQSASKSAYVPYSHFRVGAAILTDTGNIYSGCNIENSSYGATICAERNAICHAIMGEKGHLHIKAVVVYTPTSEITYPCGICLQVISEFASSDTTVFMTNGTTTWSQKFSEIFPCAFKL